MKKRMFLIVFCCCFWLFAGTEEKANIAVAAETLSQSELPDKENLIIENNEEKSIEEKEKIEELDRQKRAKERAETLHNLLKSRSRQMQDKSSYAAEDGVI